MNKILFSEHYVLLHVTTLIRPHNTVYSRIPLTAQTCLAEIHLQAA